MSDPSQSSGPTGTYDPQQGLLERAARGEALAAAALTHGQQRIAHLLAHRSAGKLLFCKAYGWLSWTGTHWSADDGVAARNELFVLLRETAATGTEADRKAATSCMNDGPQRGVLAIASLLPEFHVTLEALDADPWLLNLANGTYDLDSSELRPHDPKDRITKIARGAYDTDAPSPVWTEHLEYFQPDAEIREFLHRFFGYSLLGKVTEHVLLIAYGPQGANGKGTTDRVLQYVLGDYAGTANQNLLVQTRANSADNASPARMTLLGRRLVSMSETEKRAQIAEALMKTLTGGDPVTARALFKDEITFEPSHTLVLWTNHKPKLSGDDAAVWRRVKLVPFEVTRPKDQWDSEIDDKLKLEADAIMTWMIDGFRQWRRNGLSAPAKVEAATAEYQYEEDVTAQFIAERIVADHTANTRTADVWHAYEDFTHETQAVPITRKDLYIKLELAGYVKKRRAAGEMFLGMRIAEPETTEDTEEVLTDDEADDVHEGTVSQLPAA